MAPALSQELFLPEMEQEQKTQSQNVPLVPPGDDPSTPAIPHLSPVLLHHRFGDSGCPQPLHGDPEQESAIPQKFKGKNFPPLLLPAPSPAESQGAWLFPENPAKVQQSVEKNVGFHPKPRCPG